MANVGMDTPTVLPPDENSDKQEEHLDKSVSVEETQATVEETSVSHSQTDMPDIPKTEPKVKKSSNSKKELARNVLKKGSLIIVGYFFSYIPWSFLLIAIAIICLVWLETRPHTASKRISAKYAAISITQEELLKTMGELPAWVTFPDRERAEWLNEIIRQLWPNVNNYFVKVFKGPVEAKIRKKLKKFRFEDIDFGTAPPKIDGVKVYNRSSTRDSIIIDFDVYYDGNCEINFSTSGAQIGRIRDFQLSVEVRVVLKPLMVKMPVVGGIQVFFLNTPDMDFSIDGISGIPGLRDLIRQKVEERIRRLIVFPNKIAKRFSKSVDVAELKSLEPEGVLRVHVVKGIDLEKKDFGGTSDPYTILTVGAQEYKTHVVKRCVNPRWDYWCEFVILDPTSQNLYFKVFDQDDLNEDDFLGSGCVEIATILKEGKTDQVIELEKVKHGSVHLRFTWLGLTDDYTALNAALQEFNLLKVGTMSTAVLMVYIDSAQSLPRLKDFKKPDPYMLLRVGKHQQKSKMKRNTDDPVWEQGFVFLVSNPETDNLHITFLDKDTDTKLDEFTYDIRDLTERMNLQLSKEQFPLQKNAPASKVTMSLQLRILTNAKLEDDASESSQSDHEFSRQNSATNKSGDAVFANSTSIETAEATTEAPNSAATTVPQSPSMYRLLRTRIRQSMRRTKVEQVNTSSISNQSSVDESATATVEEKVDKIIVKNVTSTPSLRRRLMQRSVSNNSSFGDKPTIVGRIDLTIEYNEMRQKLIITIHRVMNLPIKDPDDIPDPYVTVKLMSPNSNGIKHKTKAYVDTCDPVFNESFEYLLSQPELIEQKLQVAVKTQKIFKYKNKIGQTIISLRNLDLKEPHRACYDLHPDSID